MYKQQYFPYLKIVHKYDPKKRLKHRLKEEAISQTKIALIFTYD